MKRFLAVFIAFVCGLLLREPEKVSALGSVPTSDHSYMGEIGFVGDRYIYVTVVETETTWVRNNNGKIINRIVKGDTCNAWFGGTMVVINHLPDNLLVKYESPGYNRNSGCPSGVSFYIQRVDFEEQIRNYGIRYRRLLIDQEMAREIAMQKIHGDYHPVHNGGFTFIEPANAEELTWGYEESVAMRLGDACIAETGSLKLPREDRGHIEYRGTSFINGKVLYEYHPYKNAVDGVCPKGTLFFK